MEIILQPKRYTYHDIANKRRGSCWVLLKIACILYSASSESTKKFALGLLTYLYRFQHLTPSQVEALGKVYIYETIELNNIRLDVQHLSSISQYSCWIALNTLSYSLPSLINKVTHLSYNDMGGGSIINEERATKEEFEKKLYHILYNESGKYSITNRNTAIKILLDYNFISTYTTHMKHCVDTIVENGDVIKYKELPKRVSALEGYLLIYN